MRHAATQLKGAAAAEDGAALRSNARGERALRSQPTSGPRRRIVFVNRFFHPDHSATSQLLTDLALHLAQQDEPVRVVTSRLLYDDPSARLSREELVSGVRVHRVPTTRFGRATLLGRACDLISFYLAATLAVTILCRPGDVVVAKTDPPLLSVVLAPVARLRGARLVNWLQDVYPELAQAMGVPGLSGFAGKLLRGLRDRSLKAAWRNVAIGDLMARRIRDRGVADAGIQVIPNWVDEAAVRPVGPERNPLRAAWALGDAFVVGYSGNLGRAHDHATMFAAARLLRDDPSIRFLMIGGGHGMEALRRAATEAGLENIVFKPYQPRDRLSESLSAPDVHWISLDPAVEGYILPSKVYGVLAAGRPIIALTDPEGEIARLVQAHDCGSQVNPGDAERFVDVVRALQDDVALRRAQGRAARAAALEPYGRARALAAWSELLSNATVR